MFSNSTLERFWAKVDKSGDCWLWTAGKYREGYGQFSLNRRPHVAHRVAFEMEYGSIPSGLSVLHHCDNPPCVRPTHLFVGTHRDNMADMMAKGREASGNRSGRAKLTAVQVAEIRLKFAPWRYTARRLAVEYGVSVWAIREVVSGRCWR